MKRTFLNCQIKEILDTLGGQNIAQTENAEIILLKNAFIHQVDLTPQPKKNLASNLVILSDQALEHWSTTFELYLKSSHEIKSFYSVP